MAEVDLEALASGYRHRRVSEAFRQRAREAALVARLGPGSLAVDVGGGRGDHAAEFAGTGAGVLVVDRSASMAAAARTRGVGAVVGDAGALPLRGECADLVFFHLSIHYGDYRCSLAEAARVARSGGRVEVWTFSREHLADSFLSGWFPSAADIDVARFPDPADLADEMERIGLEGAVIAEAPEIIHRPAGEWRAGVEAGFVSTLQLLPDGEVEAGLERFDAAHPDPSEVLVYRLGYMRVSAARRR